MRQRELQCGAQSRYYRQLLELYGVDSVPFP